MAKQNQIGLLPQQNRNVIAPFLSYKIISGAGFTAQTAGAAIYLNSLGGNADFNYQYFIYLKCGVTYRFQACFYVNNGGGILQNKILSSDTLTTYNTLSNIDTYSATGNAIPTPFLQTFSFSPAGFSAGDWVPCVLNSFCNSKNASSSSKFIFMTDGNAGFSFCEKYS